MDTIRVLNSIKSDQAHIFSDRMWFRTVYNNNQHTTPAAAMRCLQICHCGHLERFDKLFTMKILTRTAGISRKSAHSYFSYCKAGEFGKLYIDDSSSTSLLCVYQQRRLRRVCAFAQARLRLHCSTI